MTSPLYLSAAQTIACGATDMAAALEDVARAHRLLALGRAICAAEVAMPLPAAGAGGFLYSLPGVLNDEEPLAGVKWTAHVPANRARGLPRVTTTLVLNHARTGEALAVLDGSVIGSIRTGAMTGLAARLLARPGARVLGVLGAGAQAPFHVQGVLTACPAIERVLLWNRTAAHAEALAARLAREHGRPVERLDHPGAVLARSDIVVSCTAATEPVVTEFAFPPGALYCHTGLNEVAFDVIDRFDRVVVDEWEDAGRRSQQAIMRMHRAGRFPAERVGARIGEVLLGRAEGRQRAEQVIMFNSTGVSLTDLAIARRVWQRARAGLAS